MGRSFNVYDRVASRSGLVGSMYRIWEWQCNDGDIFTVHQYHILKHIIL